jgi:putative transposase
MARRHRQQVTGLPVHIIQRGNNRQACFYAEADYQFFLHHLAELAKRFQCEVHAYVLMTNHLHLLLTPHLARGPSLLMKMLGQRYVQYVNKSYRRSGSLWDGRFRSSVVQDGRYVLACYRYIELNPLRANMVAHPVKYPWSSCASNLGERLINWLVPHGEYLALGLSDDSRSTAYRGLFDSELDSSVLRGIRLAAHSGLSIGSERFRAEIETALARGAAHSGELATAGAR